MGPSEDRGVQWFYRNTLLLKRLCQDRKVKVNGHVYRCGKGTDFASVSSILY
jgi:hypothetical protein